jgi:predicted nucleic acid-binding protein
VLLAAADDTDPAHHACADLVETTSDGLLTSPLVIAEAGYLIDRQLGPAAEAGFYRSVANGDLLVEAITAGDWTRIAELVEQYADFRLGGTDASLIAIAERLGATRIATLDRRHFQAVRPVHCDAFEIVP